MCVCAKRSFIFSSLSITRESDRTEVEKQLQILLNSIMFLLPPVARVTMDAMQVKPATNKKCSHNTDHIFVKKKALVLPLLSILLKWKGFWEREKN